MLNNLMQKMAKLEQQQEKKRESVQTDMNQAQQEYSQTSSEVSKMQHQMSEIQASAELLEQQVIMGSNVFTSPVVTDSNIFIMQINDIKTSLEVDVSNLQSEYDNLKAQFESYLSEMKL
jgi:predicted  nucleic acid-binding Zn-ribbon protein